MQLACWPILKPSAMKPANRQKNGREAIKDIPSPDAEYFELHPAADYLTNVVSMFADYDEINARKFACHFLSKLSRADDGSILFNGADKAACHKGLDFLRKKMRAASISGDDAGAVAAVMDHDAFVWLFALIYDDVTAELPLAILVREGIA
jgi:hypothetical protein